jgi:hypothetical protein
MQDVVPTITAHIAPVPPATPMHGPGVPPLAAPVPPATPMHGPDVPSLTERTPLVAPMQGPGVPPLAAPIPTVTSAQGQGTDLYSPPIAAPLPPDTNLSPPDTADKPSSTPNPTAIKELLQKKYKRTQKMVPGVGLSARYVLSLHITTADIPLRNIGAVDWCALNPEGTVGQFNLYWDNIDNDLLKVRLTCLSYMT